jgi:hypothetical protein
MIHLMQYILTFDHISSDISVLTYVQSFMD